MTPLTKRGDETSWYHHCLLVLILCVGACLRFYALDQSSLLPNELTNINACASIGWVDMALNYSAHTGMPPVYPTLFCAFTHLTGHTDFFIRGFSALLSVVSIYLIYLVGKNFLSTTTGLLAAAILASNFPLSITFGREASPYTLFALLSLVHFFCYCRLFFQPTHIHSPMVLRFSGVRSQLEWKYDPDFPGEGCYVVGFWISGAFLFYTSPIAILQLLLEFAASINLAGRLGCPKKRNALVRSLWLPLLIASLPWWPTLYGYNKWILQGNLFLLHNSASIAQQLQAILPLHETPRFLFFLLLACSTLLFAFKSAAAYRKKSKHDLFTFYAAIQLGMAMTAFHFIASDYRSYLFYWWILMLLLIHPVAAAINLCPYPLGRSVLVFSLILVIVISETRMAIQDKYYQPGWVRDFRQAAQIIHDDTAFMQSSKTVIASSDLFDHYLDMNIASQPSRVLLDDSAPIEAIVHATDHTEFYFLEYLPYDQNLEQASTLFNILSSHYGVACATKIPWIRVVKFTHDSPSADVPPDCRDHLASRVVLQ